MLSLCVLQTRGSRGDSHDIGLPEVTLREAVKPHDWDDEEDGEWEAPVIDNPVCSVGCGKWEPPKISNPAYKGKWHAPKIDNPEYRGVWKPRQIPNPDYFLDETPGEPSCFAVVCRTPCRTPCHAPADVLMARSPILARVMRLQKDRGSSWT